MDELRKLPCLSGAQIGLDILRVGVKKENLLVGGDEIVDDAGASALATPTCRSAKLAQRPLEPGMRSPASGSSRSANSSSRISASDRNLAADFSNEGKRTNSIREMYANGAQGKENPSNACTVLLSPDSKKWDVSG